MFAHRLIARTLFAGGLVVALALPGGLRGQEARSKAPDTKAETQKADAKKASPEVEKAQAEVKRLGEEMKTLHEQMRAQGAKLHEAYAALVKARGGKNAQHHHHGAAMHTRHGVMHGAWAWQRGGMHHGGHAWTAMHRGGMHHGGHAWTAMRRGGGAAWQGGGSDTRVRHLQREIDDLRSRLDKLSPPAKTQK